MIGYQDTYLPMCTNDIKRQLSFFLARAVGDDIQHPCSAACSHAVGACAGLVGLGPERPNCRCKRGSRPGTAHQPRRCLSRLRLACVLFAVSRPCRQARLDLTPVYSRPLSSGPLALSFQRPEQRCRTFHSQEIERVIHDVTSRMTDPDLARLFENTFPSTTDTTVKFHKKAKDTGFVRIGGFRSAHDDGAWEGPQSFIITGDIVAEWLRDSTNQLRPYQALANADPAIFDLILGAINTQSEYVIESPYCNAFQPPPISDLPITTNGQDDVVHPAYEPNAVFECKYELDSLAHFLALANDFYNHTKSTEFANKRWYLALATLLEVLHQQSQPTFDPETGMFQRNEYTFQRATNMGTETLNLQGVGNPLNNDTGLIRSAFRPSEDATILGFFIPANAMMSVELARTSSILEAMGKTSLAGTLRQWSDRLRAGVLEHGVVKHKNYGDVFAYEIDGYGSSIIMDDANYPSLLALPVMGFCDMKDPVYQKTRKMLLSRSGNPYYLTGKEFKGIGGRTSARVRRKLS